MRFFSEPKTKQEALRLVFLYTGISVAVSVGITFGYAQASGWEARSALLPAVVIPLLVAPWMTWTVASYALRLHDAQLKLAHLARTDPLSGALNRRGIADFAEKAFADRFHNGGLSAIIMDVDHFKSINDTYGHSAGDAVIARVAETTRLIVGQDDSIVGRLGGDELVVLFVGRSLEETLLLAERLRDSIEQMTFIYEDQPLRVTTSIGVAVSDRGDRNAEALLKRADKSLYAAKAAGRNRVRAAA